MTPSTSGFEEKGKKGEREETIMEGDRGEGRDERENRGRLKIWV